MQVKVHTEVKLSQAKFGLQTQISLSNNAPNFDMTPDNLTEPRNSASPLSESEFDCSCFICESDRSNGPSQCATAKTLALLVGYPNILLQSGVQKVELTPSSYLLLEQLQEFAFCGECESQLEQIHLIMTQLEELHRQIAQFQTQISRRIQACLRKPGSVNQVEPGAGESLRASVRRRVLLALNPCAGPTDDCNDPLRQIQTPSPAPLPPLPHCIVKLVRLDEQPQRPSQTEEPLGFVPHITIKQEPDQYPMEMEAEEELPLRTGLLDWLEPDDDDVGDSDDEYILPMASTLVRRKKKKQGQPLQVRTKEYTRSKKVYQARLGCRYPECGFRAMRRTQITRHVLGSHFQAPNGAFLCSRCGAFFPAQPEELDKHLESHAGEEERLRFACPHCPASFTLLTNVRGHCRQKHPREPPPIKTDYPHARQRLALTHFPCSHCPSAFSELKNLRTHCKSKHAGEALPTQRDFRNADLWGLPTKLEVVKEKERRFGCRHCMAAFTLLSNLRTHHRKKHPEEAEPSRKDFPRFPLPKSKRDPGETRTCSHCAEVFTCITETNFKSHLATHTKPFKCAVAACSSQFSSSVSLKFHCVRFHPELQVLPSSLCPHCPFVTNRPQTLKAHIRAKHETHLTTACAVPGCSFRTPDASRLKQHVERVHEGTKKFLCTECGKGYYLQSKLTTHMRSHTGERPFPCRFCGKRFTERGKLRRHEPTHGSDRPFICELCGARFPTRNNLTGHRHSWHKNGFFRVGVPPTRKSKYDDYGAMVESEPTPGTPSGLIA